jgi:DUF4097 and DUF4098 domain-containing protein YvlB
VVLNNALAPLEQKQEQATFPSAQYVELQADTFNGDIEIQPTSSNQIEVTYNLEAPEGRINEIIVETTNQTQGEVFKILAKAKLVDSSEIRVNYRATILVKVPSNGQYNLTLSTLNGNIIKPLLNDKTVTATTNNGSVDLKDDNATSITASSLNGNVNVRLVEGTLFTVDATTANGQVTWQGIAMDINSQTATKLNAVTTQGPGNLDVKLTTANGNVSIEYFSK